MNAAYVRDCPANEVSGLARGRVSAGRLDSDERERGYESRGKGNDDLGIHVRTLAKLRNSAANGRWLDMVASSFADA